MKCTVCGTENPDNARFCGICGTSFANRPSFEDELGSTVPAASETNTLNADTSEALPQLGELNEENEPSDTVEAMGGADFIPAAEPSVNETSDAGASDVQRFTQNDDPSPLPPMPSPPVYRSGSPKSTFTPSAGAARTPINSVGKHEKEKEKKVVSLSVAVICIAAVFILSAVCGALVQLYFSKDRSSSRSGTAYSGYSASEWENSKPKQMFLAYTDSIC